MKITPFWYFLFILAVLIISMLFMKNKPMGESFINFNYEKPENTIYVIPGYPNKENLKIHDNVYFDTKNVALLVIEGKEHVEGAVNEPIIEKLDVINRAGDLKSYPYVTTNIIDNKPVSPIPTQPATMMNGYKSVCVTANSKKATNLQVLYVAWGLDTYIHVIDLQTKSNVVGYLLNHGTKPVQTNFNAVLNNSLNVGTDDKDTNNGTYMKDITSGKALYQLTSNLFFEPVSGCLVTKNASGTNIIYNDEGKMADVFPKTKTVSSTAFSTPWITYDLIGQNMIVVVPGVSKTMVTVVKKNADGQTFKVFGTTRFLQDGSVIKDGITETSIPRDTSKLKTVTLKLTQGAAAGTSPSSYGHGAASSPSSYGHGAASSASHGAAPLHKGENMDDYLLKTQFIPPICPACPACPSGGGTCNSCGNNSQNKQYSLSDLLGSTPSAYSGGYSNSAATNSNINKGTPVANSQVTNSPAANSKVTNSPVVNSKGYGISDTVVGLEQGVFGTANNVIGSAAMLGETALLGAGGLAYAAGSGATNLAKGIVGGVQGVAQGGYQGVTQGGAQLGSQGGAQGGSQGGAQGGAQGGSQGGVQIGAQGTLAQLSGPQNPYTYNGALSEKPSADFIPITADFSKFGR